MPTGDLNKFKFFFEKEERKNKSETSFDLLDVCKQSLVDLYENYKTKIFTNLELHYEVGALDSNITACCGLSQQINSRSRSVRIKFN